MVSAKPAETLKMTSLVTLNTRPSLVRQRRAVRRPSGRARWRPKGRLSRLLAAADADDDELRGGPGADRGAADHGGGLRRCWTATAAPSPGTGPADAARWLGGFAELQSRHDGYRLLYGSPDLAALVHDGQRVAIRAAAAASRLVELTRTLPLLVLPTGGRADAATVEAASDLDPRAIVLSDRSAAGPRPAAGRARAEAPIVSVSTAGPAAAPARTRATPRSSCGSGCWPRPGSRPAPPPTARPAAGSG